jgi:hypothetical protein
MNQESNRIPCPGCQAMNFPSSAACWQCGQPLKAEGSQSPEGPPPTAPPPPAPEPGSPYPPARSSGDTSIFVILGFVCAGLAFLCCPWLFGVAAIVLGIIAYTRGNPLGAWVIAAGAVALVIGTVIGVLVGAKMFSQGQSPWMRPGPFPTH